MVAAESALSSYVLKVPSTLVGIPSTPLEAVIRAELELSAPRRVAVLDPVRLVIDNFFIFR